MLIDGGFKYRYRSICYLHNFAIVYFFLDTWHLTDKATVIPGIPKSLDHYDEGQGRVYNYFRVVYNLFFKRKMTPTPHKKR